MGHVPTGPIPAEGEGSHVPRREHRRAGTRYPVLDRKRLAVFGESVASGFLMSRGVRILARNVRVGHGELDLVVRMGDRPVAVEVKTIQTGGLDDPVFAFTEEKARRVRTAAHRLGISRIDLVAITLGGSGVALRWIPEAG